MMGLFDKPDTEHKKTDAGNIWGFIQSFATGVANGDEKAWRKAEYKRLKRGG